jgi:hypothetical protein
MSKDFFTYNDQLSLAIEKGDLEKNPHSVPETVTQGWRTLEPNRNTQEQKDVNINTAT